MLKRFGLRRSRRLILGVSLAAVTGGAAIAGMLVVSKTASSSVISQADAVRLAKQASFGPTVDLVNHIVTLGGASAWLNEQFNLNTSTYVDLSHRTAPTGYCSAMGAAAASNCNRDYFTATPVAMRFYANAISGNDQLRQRVAFALSELIVASDVNSHSTAGLAGFNQIFMSNAFGNYRDILKAVTLHPYMADFLNMADSSKTAPNENYARELMQLFSLGPVQLNADGSAKVDAAGVPLPAYTQTDIDNIARALTGWTYTRLNGAPITDKKNLDYSQPMVPSPTLFDPTAKSFLGVNIPAGATQQANVDAVIDAVFNNANTAPFVARHLISQLVTANPSPAYIARVSAVFANNGSGVRGDLKAVVRAILLDPEARGDAKTGTNDGKVKEPVLLLTSLGRLIGDKTDGYAFTARDDTIGQPMFRSPSVFNFYPRDFPLPGGSGLVSPASKTLTTATIIARHNLVFSWIMTGPTPPAEYAVQTSIPGASGTQPDWSPWEAFGTNVDGILDRVNLLMMNNTMTSAQRAALKTALLACRVDDPKAQTRRQAQAAIYVVATSPMFEVDR